MRVLKTSLCYFLLFLLCACSKGEFHDLSSFISSYNKTSENKISITDFIINKDGAYTSLIGEAEDGILLNLKEGVNGKIESIKVIITKAPDTLPKQTDISLFRKVLSDVLVAYCSYKRETVDEIINAFGLNSNSIFERNGELTLKRERFYFVYYSDDVTNQIIILNTYLTKIEETSKPVSKPYYGENFIEK